MKDNKNDINNSPIKVNDNTTEDSFLLDINYRDNIFELFNIRNQTNLEKGENKYDEISKMINSEYEKYYYFLINYDKNENFKNKLKEKVLKTVMDECKNHCDEIFSEKVNENNEKLRIMFKGKETCMFDCTKKGFYCFDNLIRKDNII